MINYLVTKDHNRTILIYLHYWAAELKARFNVLSYESLIQSPHKLPAGTFIFADLERLDTVQMNFATALASAVDAAGFRVLNRPGHTLFRYELLKALYEAGINKFKAYKVEERPDRFPVFLRLANQHTNAQSKLLYSQSELDETIEEWLNAGKPRSQMIIVEFLDHKDAKGIYRNYSILRIGNKFLPRHLFYGSDWIVKHTTVPETDELVREEKEFIEHPDHPHIPLIRKVFDIAGVRYGRIDYAIVDGDIQVWEINTNPMILQQPQFLKPHRIDRTVHIGNAISRAFNEIEDPRGGQLELKTLVSFFEKREPDQVSN